MGNWFRLADRPRDNTLETPMVEAKGPRELGLRPAGRSASGRKRTQAPGRKAGAHPTALPMKMGNDWCCPRSYHCALYVRSTGLIASRRSNEAASNLRIRH